MVVEDAYSDDLELDRKFFNFSSWIANAFSWTHGLLGYRLVAPIDPQKFDNASSKAKEIGVRVLIVLAAVTAASFAGIYLLLTAAVLGSTSKLFRAAGFYFQKNGFTHIRGDAPEKSITEGQAKVMTWNIRGHGGGLHYETGVVHWHSRIDRICDAIRKEEPDVLVLQEVSDTSLIESLVAQLKSQYAHFYTHIGTDMWGKETGCVVITKCPVHQFTHTPFLANDSKAQRGFETLEIKAHPEDEVPCARIIGTQLSSGKEAKEIRMHQISEIVDTLAQKKLAVPTLFVGNMNVDRDSPEEGAYLSQYLYHSYQDKEPTYSAALGSQWAPIYEGKEESRDFVSLFKREPAQDPQKRIFPVAEKGIRLLNSYLVKAFDETYDTKTALSDHHAVVTTFSGLK
jgi:endonuclease/exonuclease/phosphatase family metal-dependent hydrolase